MSTSKGQLYVANDNVVWLEGLYDNVSAEYVNDATVTYRLLDSSGTVVITSTSMTYKTASNGVYYGTIEEDAALTVGSKYTVEVTASASSDRVGEWNCEYYAKQRGRT